MTDETIAINGKDICWWADRSTQLEEALRKVIGLAPRTGRIPCQEFFTAVEDARLLLNPPSVKQLMMEALQTIKIKLQTGWKVGELLETVEAALKAAKEEENGN